jgi:CRP-like cAMP-binding protein
VERLILLRRLTPFAAARLEPLSLLARSASERSLAAGTVVARCGDRGHRILVVLAGRLRATSPGGGTHDLGPGAAIGALETIGAMLHLETIEAIEPARVLEISSERLLDVLEDHADLSLSILTTLARRLLE